MADALKAMYNKVFLCRFGEKVRSVYDSFDIEGFVAAAMDEPWAFQLLAVLCSVSAYPSIFIQLDILGNTFINFLCLEPAKEMGLLMNKTKCVG